MLTYLLYKNQSMILSASQDKPKQSINLHPVYNENTFSLASSWDQLLAYFLFRYIVLFYS